MATHSTCDVMAFAVMVVLGGCAVTPSKVPPPVGAATQAAPKILGRTTDHGRGVPWGRSDSADAFTQLTRVAAKPGYGWTQDDPIKVGGLSEGPEIGYLNGLRGPAGEPVDYERIGSCCPFKTDKGMVDGVGLLDAFRVTYKGQAQAAILYIDFYDEAPLFVPMGFTPRQP